MKFEIKDKKKNPLMKRDDVVVRIDHEGKATPNRIRIMEEVAKLLGTKKENLVVNRILTAAGSTVSEARVFSYSRKDDIPEWRTKKMDARISKIKNSSPAETKPSEAPAEGESSSTESPTDTQEAAPEKKEDAPAEEKPSSKGSEESKD